MVFDEVKKGKQTFGKFLKSDLQKMMQENSEVSDKHPNWEKNLNVAELQKILVEEKIIEGDPVFNRVVIDFEENPEIVTAFITIYKVVLNRLAIMSLYDVPLEFLPNPFADYSGEESWVRFKETLDDSKTWKDTVKQISEANKEEI